jgi:antitoxin VapB
METTTVFHTTDAQAVRLPDGFRFESDTVSIRREGAAVILEPIKASEWPPNFFNTIQIDDSGFARPEQGAVPQVPAFD